MTIEVGEGQRAEVAVEGLGRASVIATVPGVADARDAIAWTTRAGTYEINVSALFRGVGTTPFRLRLSVTGG